MNKLINLDVAGGSILLLSKNDLTETARSLESEHDFLTEYEMLYKLQYLIKTRLEMLKDDAQDVFIEKYGGSKSERENGFIISMRENMKYEFSEDVKDLESEIKLLNEQLKQMKEKEKKDGSALTGEVEKETLSFTLK